MGLCKCPKRRVTNQFCFEHRVNVCEHCIVTNHAKCIVQSYLQWLQDSDYNPICEICTKTLGDEECIRLTCYHVYHWSCLESTFRSLPRTTAPAGYQCPSCRTSLFPPSNLVSPVADVLREKLAGVNWARAGLGLPLLGEDIDAKSSTISRSSFSGLDNSGNQYGSNGYSLSSNSSIGGYSNHGDSMGMSTPHRATPVGASDDESNPRIANGPPYSVVQVQDDSSMSMFGNRAENYQGGQVSRKVFESLNQNRHTSSRFDYDEDKYKRKSALERIVRWWKNTLSPVMKRRSMGRRNTMAIILVLFVVVTILVIMAKIGRASIENDPALDPKNNLNIIVHDG
ncbi:zinc finger protein-like 1 [Arctopsyche grandis]|uniref:zinc finger protein-like 1 n=1 Tax=Arctopsyche grandis TaxID=121162 RepID=UPI00406D7229